MIVDLNTADPFAANFECPDFIFSLQLGRRDYDIAISSDKMISRSLVPGSVTVSPKGSVIKAITGAVNAEFLAFCVSSGSVAEALDAAGRVPNDLRIVPDLQHPDIPNLAQMMRRFLLSPDRRTYIYGETLGLAILLNVIASLEAPKVAPRLALSARQVSQVCDYVDAHLAEQLSLADLARLLSMSVYDFNRAFGATMSMSPYQYIIERRVVYAREMLADPQLSLADVAYAVGFSSQAHMTDVFRKRLDTTPGAYRKEVLK